MKKGTTKSSPKKRLVPIGRLAEMLQKIPNPADVQGQYLDFPVNTLGGLLMVRLCKGVDFDGEQKWFFEL